MAMANLFNGVSSISRQLNLMWRINGGNNVTGAAWLARVASMTGISSVTNIISSVSAKP